jgi:hypothetical protein
VWLVVVLATIWPLSLIAVVSLYLSEPGREVHVKLEDAPEPEPVTERRVLLRSA